MENEIKWRKARLISIVLFVIGCMMLLVHVGHQEPVMEGIEPWGMDQATIFLTLVVVFWIISLGMGIRSEFEIITSVKERSVMLPQADVKFCPFCGGKAEGFRHCPNCGKQVKA